ncbi:hypothetical protein [Micromonospora sp. HUAS LYJ1]|uniref:hypothetical protein n=1 Tax=Micromonospora sp. HUAS LYJ1 TaxID=3061626 RepID=UPI0026729B63|nr:hypothetical protein [Micromonospora sp. HUAS LYJ1]WKU03896.1 hypothetical protein Q2K16_24110 [Micromonospora sp. HUAS LYJ1]
MIRAASTPPVWVSRLRDLTRLAVTALVLAAGLGGFLAVTGGPAAAATRPSVVTSRVATLPADARPADDRADTRPDDGSLRPQPPTPTDGAAARPVAPAAGATPDPARDATGRRGPPRS